MYCFVVNIVLYELSVYTFAGAVVPFLLPRLFDKFHTP
jgi:hypothetical protein